MYLWFVKNAVSIGVYFLALLAVMGAGAYLYSHYISGPELKAAQKQYDDLVRTYNEAIRNANKAASIKSAENAQVVGDLTSKLKETQDDLSRKTKKLRDLAKIIPNPPTAPGRPSVGSTGGLSIVGASCDGQRTPGNVQAGADPAPTAGSGNQAQCRLSESTANALISIAEDGDAAINQLNSVIDAYNKVQANGCWVTTPSTGLGLKPSPKRE